LSIAEAGTRLRDGRLTAAALTEHALARIAVLDPALHAFVLVTEERARAAAAQADRDLAAGIDRGPMHGIPYALKDVFDAAGLPTTCQSRLMLEHVPDEDATVEALLRAGGGVLLGKLATHEFALGGPSFDLPFPPARNPWNTGHFTGASSSGSGAAVAAGLVPVSIGTDTSGSIRNPACLCGIVGLKPTYGLVSRRGAFPLSHSLDHCGPLARTVGDIARVMQVIAVHDPHDPSSLEGPPPDFIGGLLASVEGLRVGYARELFTAGGDASSEVVASLDRAAQAIADLGAVVDEVRLPDFALFNACGRVIMTAEGHAIHERDLRERPLLFGRYTYQRLVPGAALSAADLIHALRLRRELTVALNTGPLATHEVLITASALAPAARLSDFPLDWPPPRAATATATIPFNVTGNPALALPTGLSGNELPLGMQIVGRALGEPTVLRLGAAFEAVAGMTERAAAMRRDLSV
jgi:aspartyl-tRNA(Asn)/glutamyl-tRNA(Gln) amidotransferase subunit A